MVESFSKEERAAMSELAKDRKLKESRAESLAATLERIETMAPADRELALSVHKLALDVNPDFEVRTWYGMPAYYIDGQVVLFFQDGEKFKTRYSTIGFQQAAKLDSGTFWATSYAVTAIDSSVAKEITTLIMKAIG